MDRETSTKNGLDKGKTEIFTRHIYRTQSVSGDEVAVEWMNENGEMVAYGQKVVKKKRETKVRTKSENSAQYSEGISLERRKERTRGKQRGLLQDSVGV